MNMGQLVAMRMIVEIIMMINHIIESHHHPHPLPNIIDHTNLCIEDHIEGDLLEGEIGPRFS